MTLAYLSPFSYHQRVMIQTLRQYPTATWLLLIVSVALFLRLYNLADAPPGLTHDEADHGITALSILNEGVRDVYFTVGHGREPLYDYATAAVMLVVGQSYMAGRVTAVFFSLLMLLAMFAWVRRAYDTPTALITAAALAVSFWPVMAARQALRSITLPALYTAALFLFWHTLPNFPKLTINNSQLTINNSSEGETGEGKRPSGQEGASRLSRPYGLRALLLLPAALLLGLTFYTYIPARVLWLAFPALLGYWLLTNRPFFRQTWAFILILLFIAALVGLPLFLYLNANPTAEIRIQELSAPLTAVRSGDFSLLWQNTVGTLKLFTITGDPTWRYNIPERPFLNPVLGAFFYIGLIIAVAQTMRWKKEPKRAVASFFALVWLLLGLSPVFITGPELSTTQAMGIQPVLYLFPALALTTMATPIVNRQLLIANHLWLPLLILFAMMAGFTFRDYFTIWATAPEVRVQYESTMVTAMRHLNENDLGAVAVSTTQPDQFHTPAVAAMTLHNEAVEPRWFDGRSALLLPNQPLGTLILPGFTPLPDQLTPFLNAAPRPTTLSQPETDLDRPLRLYRLPNTELLEDWGQRLTLLDEPVGFGQTAVLYGHQLTPTQAQPGDTISLITFWRLEQAQPNLRLFTHVQEDSGVPVAQADLLSAPSRYWKEGDFLLQLHQITLPPNIEPTSYPLAVGIYQQLSDGTAGPRLPTSAQTDIVPITTLEVVNEK